MGKSLSLVEAHRAAREELDPVRTGAGLHDRTEMGVEPTGSGVHQTVRRGTGRKARSLLE